MIFLENINGTFNCCDLLPYVRDHLYKSGQLVTCVADVCLKRSLFFSKDPTTFKVPGVKRAKVVIVNAMIKG